MKHREEGNREAEQGRAVFALLSVTGIPASNS